MIPANMSLVTLNPARQAVLQAIVETEQRIADGKHLTDNPWARAFLRRLTGSSRLNTASARKIPGLCWLPGHMDYTLKQVEEALNELISSGGERCPLALPGDVQAVLFPQILWQKKERTRRRHGLNDHKQNRIHARQIESGYLRQQNLLGKARIALNFCTPVTLPEWYARWQEELDERELVSLFWAWQRRFPSLEELNWLRLSGEPFWSVISSMRQIVHETPYSVAHAESWRVPDKLVNHRGRLS